MIHESLSGGFLGAVVIFGVMYAGIVAGAAVALVALAKIVPTLQKKRRPAEGEEGQG